MRRRARLLMFFAAAGGFAALFLAGLRGLPPFQHYRGPYGYVANAISVPERSITDVVTAVNFDFRGFDTLGEEFILFTAVIGVAALLRRLAGETQETEEQTAPGRRELETSDATRVFTLTLVGMVTLFGIYIVAHGQITPGGGFQGGAILATAPLMVYLAGDFESFRRIASPRLVEPAEALGAAGYVFIGLAAMFLGFAFLYNFIPKGGPGTVISGGTVALISASVGLEVAAGFVLLLNTFLEEFLRRGRPG
jgi:multicomponent Na+:H+ antiporter subunit B